MEEKNINEINKEILQFKKDIEENIKQANNQNQENNSEENEELELTEILNITYYDEFDFKTKFKDVILMLEDVYIVELEKSNSTTYEIYTKDAIHKIAQIDIEGKITFIDRAIEDNTTIEEMKKLNEDKKTISYTKEELDELEEGSKKEIDKEKNEEGTNPDVNLNDISDSAREKKEEMDKENDRERTLDENVRKYYEN